MTSNKKNRKKGLARWHSRIGMLSCLFVVVLAISGLLINHAHDLKLDKRVVSHSLLLSLYGVQKPALYGVQLEGRWLLWLGNELFYNNEQLVECSGAFVGAITLPNYWVAACENNLLVFSYEQELVESVGSAVGVHFPLTQIGACQGLLCFQSRGDVFQMNIETLALTKFTEQEGHFLQWSAPVSPPADITSEFNKKLAGQITPVSDITWERVLLDIHAGRFFGPLGPWIMDGVALLFLALAVSGFLVWRKKHRAHH
jgi:hypothetical protein